MTSIQNQILQHIITIKGDVGGIKDHLETLNGTVERQQKIIDCYEKKIQKINVQMAKWVGIATTIGIGIHYSLSIFLS